SFGCPQTSGVGNGRKKGTVCGIFPEHHHLGGIDQLDTELKKTTMKTKKELPMIALVLLPFLYLALIWDQLPQQVPMHYNLQGEVDRYGDRGELLWIPFLLPFLTYMIFLVVPLIDPKKQLQKMGNKYHSLKFLLTGIMSVLALYLLYSAKNQ